MRTIYDWTLPRAQITLGRRTAVMGILNVTPDSFADGGAYFDRGKAVARAQELESQGADIVDLGAESSRPGSVPISEEEELGRLIPVLETVFGRVKIPISVDTYRAAVARRALEAGAQVINDISAFRFDSRMAESVSEFRAGVVLMHSRGSRETLHAQPPMEDPVHEVFEGLREAVAQAVRAGIPGTAIVVDPGIGFGKRADESLDVLRRLSALCPLGCPLLVGTSRKSFLRKFAPDPLWGTAASVASAVLQGAHAVRVHDVREMRALVDALDAIGTGGPIDAIVQ